MSAIKTGCLLLFFYAALINIQAQPYYDFDITTRQLKKTGDHAIRQKDSYSAISYYEKYCQLKPTDHKAALQLGHLYRRVRDYGKAATQYKKALELSNEKNVIGLYYLGKMQMGIKDYEGAIISFNTFRKQSRKKKYNDLRSLAKTHIEGCDMAMQDTVPHPAIYLTHPGNGVNMAYMESAPLPVGQEQLIFASLKSDTIIHYRDSTFIDTVAFKSRLFLADLEGEEWVSKGALKGPFNHPEYEVGNGCFDAAGEKFYFTRCRKNWKYKMICHLYVSRFENNVWSEPELLNDDVNLKNYTSTQPTVGWEPKGGYEVLYFSSDRPRGKGGLDIWYTQLKKGKYAEPKNCGARINTEGDETTPYCHLESNSLYFSSDGHPSYGQADVFKSFGQKSKWVKTPENLGLPINSPADDLYYILSDDPKKGFLTSNREGGIALKNPTCCDDIYAFEDDENRSFLYNAVIISENDLKIDSGTVDVYLRDRNTSDTTYIKSIAINQDGTITLNVQKNLDYLLILKTEDHFNTLVRIPKDTSKVSLTDQDTILMKKIDDRAIVLKNIYYDFDDWRLTAEAEKAIDSTILEILILNPEIKVEISSHTDSKGNGLYNLKLSQKRAESVVMYLRKEGIDRSRMIAKGYGQTKPISPNTHPDGSDNEEGRQLNRRTEFKVLDL